MEKEFVPYDLSLRMKRLGFNELCFGFYDDIDDNHLLSFIRIESLSDKLKSSITLAPTWQSAFSWFREKYGMHYNIHRFNFKKGTDEEYLAEVDSTSNFSYFRTYDECVAFCLEKLIEIVEERNNERNKD